MIYLFLVPFSYLSHHYKLNNYNYNIFYSPQDYLPCSLTLFAASNIIDNKDIDEDCKNQIPLNDPEIDLPTYTIIIPLTPGDFSTVVFEQAGKYNNFSEYKAASVTLDEYISDEDWQKYCSHCHAEDQKYLTLHEVFNWQVGDLFAFDRTLFHCSANFQTEKKAIVAWLSK